MNENVKTPLLSVKDLRTGFKTDKSLLRAVEGVSFELGHGETLGIVGESGCGKSISCMSLLKLIQGDNVVYEGGSAIFEGERDLCAMSDKQLQQVRGKEISFIFQEPMTALNPLYTIGDQMCEVLKIHRKMKKGAAMQLAEEYLSRVKISNPREVLMRYPHSLSGGMRQRVMIAMALITNPKLIIADEPTTALDVTIQAQVLDLMRELQAEFGCSYIFITHDLGVISEMADRVVVMYGGRVCESAETDELFEHPLHPYTQGLISSRPHRNLEADRLRVIPGNVPSLANKPTGCPFHTRCEHAGPHCSEQFPQETVMDDGHRVSCWLYSEGEVQ